MGNIDTLTTSKYMTIEEFLADWHSQSTQMLVHTSGSTGTPKPIWVDKSRMIASAEMTCNFLHLQPSDSALLCMPIDFIAGKMMIVRSVVRQLCLYAVAPSAHPFATAAQLVYPADRNIANSNTHSPTIPQYPTDGYSLVAMTPMQVYSTMQVTAEREQLMKSKHLVIGGGAVSSELEQKLSAFPNQVWSSYGMTETLSHIALRPINGTQASEWYCPMSGITVGLAADGCLWIDAPTIADGRIETNDIVTLHPDGKHFKIVGRKDNVICSGGLKIQAEEVEHLLSQRLHVPYMISKRKDEKYGEVVVLLVENGWMSEGEIANICSELLPRYWRPKHIITTDSLPLTATGKPNRAAAADLCESEFGI